ncbi:LAETG motif-containing sortase-dependent surface protein [Streptomyces sp. 4N124]|uniref:LAETG motif-containing sortase-dependent surface protein n=1 Tax=Streptomyces sp. 4N124 TaxID=3457420 RepID=UPI003FD07D5B
MAALAASAFLTVAVPVIGAGAASATPSGGCQSATVQYRIVGVDGNVVGADWTSQGGFHAWDTVPETVEVRLAPGQSVGDGCKYPVSLAEYTAEGANWYTSGRQSLVDKATVYLTAADVAAPDDAQRAWQKLTVKTPDCYGQIDLYGDDITYDGGTGEGHGPAPYQPDGVITPYHLIAAWNGGEKPCTPSTPNSPTPTPSEPTPSAPATPTTPADNPPPTEATTPPTTPKPSATPPTTPDVPPLESTPPTTPEPTPSDSTPPLAETGSSAPTGLIAAGAALIVALGAGAMYAASRRTRRS